MFLEELDKSLVRARKCAKNGEIDRPNMLIHEGDTNCLQEIIRRWAHNQGIHLVVRDISALNENDMAHFEADADQPDTVFLLINYNDYSYEKIRDCYRKLVKDATIVKPGFVSDFVSQNYLFTIAICSPSFPTLPVEERAWFRAVHVKLPNPCAYLNRITDDHVISFLFRILFGKRFQIVKNAKSEDDIIRECLLASCAPAFSHVTKNTGKKAIDYGKIITSHGDVYNCFIDYCKCLSSQAKAAHLVKEEKKLVQCFRNYKTALCFGHFQKLFNLALKLYICVYVFRSSLGIVAYMGKIINCLSVATADCPIDSRILKILETEYGCCKFSKVKWSQLCGQAGVQSYCEIQDEISRHSSGNNLWFDFEHWK